MKKGQNKPGKTEKKKPVSRTYTGLSINYRQQLIWPVLYWDIKKRGIIYSALSSVSTALSMVQNRFNQVWFKSSLILILYRTNLVRWISSGYIRD